MTVVATCPRCGAPLPTGGPCASCPRTGPANKTMVVAIQREPGRAAPLPAGDDVARIPLPEGWEISLDIIEGPDRGTSHRILRSRVMICRGGGDIPLSDPRTSRTHASLEVYGSTCVLIKDLGSTNGTFVNGRRVNAAELADGDEIRVGDTKLVIMIGTPPA